ncbi:MAG: O-antigen ligase family protein [Coriobacteriia bacterium]|nr:O-antigen ligase family protein [Coriobacteriia bacterium]
MTGGVQGGGGQRIARACVYAAAAFVPLVSAGVPFGQPWLFDRFELLKLAVLAVLTCAGLAAWLSAWASGAVAVRTHPWMRLGVVVGAWYLLVTALSVSPAASVMGTYGRWDGLVTAACCLGVWFLGVQVIDSPQRIRALARALATSGSAVALYALVQHAGSDPVAWGGFAFGEGRVFATFGNPDLLAAYLTVPLAIAPALALSEPDVRLRWAWWAATALTASALVVTFVRGGWIGGGLGLAVLALAVWRLGVKPSRSAIAAMLACSVIVGCVAYSTVGSASPVTDAAKRATSVVTAIAGGDQRTDIWAGGVRAVLARPLTGTGPDTFRLAFARYRTEGFTRRWGGGATADNAHDWPLQLAVTLGLPGALLVLALILGSIGIALPATSRRGGGAMRLPAAALAAACAGYLAALVVLLPAPGTTFLLWLLAGCLLGTAARPSDTAAPGVARALALASPVIVLVVAVWAGSWLLADSRHRAGMLAVSGEGQADALASAARTNPLVMRYEIEYGALLAEQARQLGASGSASGLDVAKQAEASFRRASALSPWDGDALRDLARILGEMSAGGVPGYTSSALTAAADAVEASPNDPISNVMYAVALLRSGQTVRAVEVAKHAQYLDPRWAEGEIALADALRVAGDIPGATAHYRAALRLDAGNSYATDQLAALATGPATATPAPDK